MDSLIIFILASLCLHIYCNIFTLVYYEHKAADVSSLITKWIELLRRPFEEDSTHALSWFDVRDVDLSIWPQFWPAGYWSVPAEPWTQSAWKLTLTSFAALNDQISFVGWFVHVVAILIWKQKGKWIQMYETSMQTIRRLQSDLMATNMRLNAMIGEMKRTSDEINKTRNTIPDQLIPPWYYVDYVSGEVVGIAIVRLWHLRGMKRPEMKKRLTDRYQAAKADNDWEFITKLREEAEFLFGAAWINQRLPLPTDEE